MNPFDLFPTLMPFAFTNPQMEEDPPPFLFKLIREKTKAITYYFCDGPSNVPALHLQHNLHKKKLKDQKIPNKREKKEKVDPFISSCSVFANFPSRPFIYQVHTPNRSLIDTQIIK